MMINPPNLLEKVADITSGERRRDYGRPYINHLRIAIRWSRRMKQRITPSMVVWLMIDLKDARQQNTPKYDNLVDTAGYIVCLDDMARQCVELNRADSYDEALEYLDEMSLEDVERDLHLLEEEERLGEKPLAWMETLRDAANALNR